MTQINWTEVLAEVKKEYRRNKAENPNASDNYIAVNAMKSVATRLDIGHGIEGFSDIYGNYGVDYINMGDAYDTTIILRGNRFTIGNWGDIVERHPSRYR